MAAFPSRDFGTISDCPLRCESGYQRRSILRELICTSSRGTSGRGAVVSIVQGGYPLPRRVLLDSIAEWKNLARWIMERLVPMPAAPKNRRFRTMMSDDLTAERCGAIAESLKISINHFGLCLN